jgi:N-formylglutamate amidohydrolase
MNTKKSVSQILDRPPGPALFTFYSALNSPTGIVSIPHSGEIIPEVFTSFLTPDQTAKDQDLDYKVNQLVEIEELRKAGISVIVAHIHRVAVDLNRSPELAVLNWKKNSHGVPLVLKEPTPADYEKLKLDFYYPYYEMLKSMINEVQRAIQKPVPFVDLHSMPSTATAYHLQQNPMQKKDRPDFCLSDRHGKTCPPEFIGEIKTLFQQQGYLTTINDPYQGGYITEFVGTLPCHNIQIEINRKLYMDEQTQTLIPEKVQSLKKNITKTLINFLK